MRKTLRNRKALSPVIAAIILIAVTVAVSIAVAAWMGSLTIGFMETEELTITNIAFTDTAGSPPSVSIDVSVTNTGTSDVTISMIKVNGETRLFTGDTITIEAGDSTVTPIIIPYITWEAGIKYSVSLFATDGTLVSSFTATA